jgi:hypothetical protein
LWVSKIINYPYLSATQTKNTIKEVLKYPEHGENIEKSGV